MEYKILVAERDYYAIVKYENMTIKTIIEHRRKTATLSTATIKTNSSTLINPVESFIKFLPRTTIRWDTSDGDYLCYQSDSLLIWVILEDQNEKCYRDAYEEQKRHVEIYKKNADVLKQNNTSQLKKISLLQDKLDSSTGALLTSKKECDRLTKEIYIIKNERDKATRELIAQNQIEYNKLTKELFICQTEKSELIEEIKIYIANEDIYKQNLEKRKIKIEKLQKKVEELTAN